MDSRYHGQQNEEFMREKFNREKMTITVNWMDDDDMAHHDLPAKFEVCPTCEGKGKHVNPSIDDNGITGQDFAEDPDFEENYRSGTYDVQCYECHGSNVIPVVDRESITESGSDEDKTALKTWDEALEDEYAWRAESEAERRMGA